MEIPAYERRSSTPSSATEVRRALADPTGVTFAQFQQLQTGMSYAEAVTILGDVGTEQSRSDLAGFVTVMHAWQGDGSLGANMNAMFQNGRRSGRTLMLQGGSNARVVRRRTTRVIDAFGIDAGTETERCAV